MPISLFVSIFERHKPNDNGAEFFSRIPKKLREPEKLLEKSREMEAPLTFISRWVN